MLRRSILGALAFSALSLATVAGAAATSEGATAGVPAQIADTMQEWFEAGLADGFMIQPAYFPGAFDDFVNLVVPELQRRGLFRREYAGATLRDHLRQGTG